MEAGAEKRLGIPERPLFSEEGRGCFIRRIRFLITGMRNCWHYSRECSKPPVSRTSVAKTGFLRNRTRRNNGRVTNPGPFSGAVGRRWFAPVLCEKIRTPFTGVRICVCGHGVSASFTRRCENTRILCPVSVPSVSEAAPPPRRSHWFPWGRS